LWFSFHPNTVSIHQNCLCCLIRTYHWYQSTVTMASNEKRIEALKSELTGVQDGMQWLKLGLTNKLHYLEKTINKLLKTFLSTREVSSNNNHGWDGSFHSHLEENDGNKQIFSSNMVKLAFLKYFREDPTEWLNRVTQFFEF
jgi:hypothetical protein